MADDTNRRDEKRQVMHARRMADRTVVIPPVRNRARRARARNSLEYHARIYHRASCCDPFSDDQKDSLKIIEKAVKSGGHYAFVEPRGNGKTTRAEIAIEWMILHGWKSFPVVVGSDAAAAGRILESIKTEFETNDKLADDFPEICLPVRELEGNNQRCKGQLARLESEKQEQARRTAIVWGGDRVVFPDVSGSVSGGAVLIGVGLEAGIRGIKHKGRDGKTIRPDFALLDDAQTDESAKSKTQTDYREGLILRAVLGLAGPRRKLSAAMAGTIICRNDLMDRFTDHNLHPDWQGRRMKMVYAWPESIDLWKEYAQIRRRGQAEGDAGKAATDFYRQHRAEMDKGAKVAWESRKNPGELSAIQHAWNLRIDRGEDAFQAEYQGEPVEHTATVYELRPELVLQRCNGRPELTMPVEPVVITGGVDLNRYGLSWCLAATTRMFCTSLLAYGVHTVAGAEKIYAEGQSEAEAVAFYRAMDDLLRHLAALRIVNAAGAPVRIRRLGIDAGYLPRTVRPFAANSGPWPWETLATRGRSSVHYRETGPNVQSRGENWLELLEPGQPGPMVVYNADTWMESTQTGFLLPLGAPGGLDLFGDPYRAQQHNDFAGHICAQKLAEKLIGDKGPMYRWTQQGRNDLLDALVISRVLASHSGCSLLASAVQQVTQQSPNQALEKQAAPPKPKPLQRVSYQEDF